MNLISQIFRRRPLLVLGMALASALPLAAASETVSFEAPWTSAFRVDPQFPHQFINREGEHLFLYSKTAWAYFGCRDPEGFLKKAKAQGVNVIRVALEGRPYYAELGIELWPWGGTRDAPDFTTFNEPYWDEVERRIRLAGDYGIGFNLTLYFSYKDNRAEDVPVQRAYWERTLSRLGKYSNVFIWEIHNEYTANPEFQDAAGSFFAGNDPLERPVCTSGGSGDEAVWPEKPWVSLGLLHSCTGSRPLDDWYIALARNARSHGKPAVCNESGRERRHRNDDPIHRRKQGWVWCTAGAFWNWHSWDGCEGIDDRAYKAPGEEFTRPLVDFFTSLPFWRMQPNFTAVKVPGDRLVSAVLAEADRATVLAYFCTERSDIEVPPTEMILSLHGGNYTARFIDPATLEPRGETLHIATKGPWQKQRITSPGFVDDLVLLIRRDDAVHDIMPGTE